MDKLTPAADLAAASTPYPNDSAQYRAARMRLLADEITLRRQLESVAAQRRALPLGGLVEHDRFLDENGNKVTLADMFGKHDTLITYFWMYGPQRKQACPMCTSFLGGFDIPVADIVQRVAFAVLGRSPVARQLAFARQRGWRNLSFYAAEDDAFAHAYRALTPDGEEMPALDVWVRRDGKVYHFWAPEMGGTEDPGQDPRGAPDLSVLWNVLDLTPAGRGTDWYPKLSY